MLCRKRVGSRPTAALIVGGVATSVGCLFILGGAPAIVSPAWASSSSEYAATVEADGAQNYWRLDETSGGTFADIVGGVDGTWTGSPTLGSPGGVTDGDAAATLDGSSQYGSVPPSIDFTNSMTVEAWVKTSDLSSNQSVVWRQDTSEPSYGLEVEAGQPKALFNAGHFGVVTLADSNSIDSGWHYLAATFDNGEATLYVDGTAVDSAETYFSQINTFSDGPLLIGSFSSDGSGFFDGSVDEVALYPTALSYLQIANHFVEGTTAANPYADPNTVVADDTGSVYVLDSDGAYHQLADDDTAYQNNVYWCADVSSWCGATHYPAVSSFPRTVGAPIASCGCEFWVELPSGVVYQFDSSDAEYHQIPDADTAAALGLSQCGSDWCGVHHDSALPAPQGDPMPSINSPDSVDALGGDASLPGKGERFDQVRGSTTPANGARASWIVRLITAGLPASGDHANQTLWVGANGKNPQDTFVEVGTLAGSQKGDHQNHWAYYTARGINCQNLGCVGVGQYDALNLSAMGPPPLGSIHTFAAFYSGSSFQVNIDGQAHFYWGSVRGPTIEYDLGYEAICAEGAGSCSGETDTVSRSYVYRIQFHQIHDGAWINTDRGQLQGIGAGGSGGIDWCTFPHSFRDWLNTPGDHTTCG
jgi:hypothetical protein